ncbi:hypothetical protein HPP92_000599 [Vanilla planifolia]|uniref:FAE domain-containing protein n=1 Tax=Vanilla planifolia TaxID=51239 RepID=A0A835VIW7_VANPL|nr:hypothetical protein HPP92_000599 [Vanilla planifolia]
MLSDFKQSVKLKYVKLGYHYLVTHGMYLFLTPFVGVLVAQVSSLSPTDLYLLWDHLRFNLISVILCSTLLVFLSTIYFLSRPRPVYLVDFACHKSEDGLKCSRKTFIDRSRLTGLFNEENLEFQTRILERSGLGETTYVPETFMKLQPNPSMAAARKEGENRDVRRHRRAVRQNESKTQECRNSGRELQPIQPNPFALCYDRQPL